MEPHRKYNLSEAEGVVSKIVDGIDTAQEEETLHFSLAKEVGVAVVKLLDNHPVVEAASGSRVSYNSFKRQLDVLIMPTPIHNAHQSWIQRSIAEFMALGSITLAEYRLLIQETGSQESDFVGAYAGSSKEPDFSISHQHLNFPHLVVESGWSESFPRLRNDKNLWINGGGRKVRVVLLFKWSARVNNRVAGVIEVWVGDAAGNDSLAQTEDIFPAPAPHIAAAQAIRITRGQLFGNVLHPGRNPNEVLDFPMNSLRELASNRMGKMGLQTV